MKKPRTRYKALIHECLEFTLAYTRNGLTILGNITPAPRPLELAGNRWEPGTRFLKLGGKKTSAGFEVLEFTKPYPPLEYIGIFENLDGSFACFKQNGKPVGGYFAYFLGDDELIFATDACSGRVIEMTHCRVAK